MPQFPIGIDSDRFTRALELPQVQNHIKDLKERFSGRKVWTPLLYLAILLLVNFHTVYSLWPIFCVNLIGCWNMFVPYLGGRRLENLLMLILILVLKIHPILQMKNSRVCDDRFHAVPTTIHLLLSTVPLVLGCTKFRVVITRPRRWFMRSQLREDRMKNDKITGILPTERL